MFKDSLNFANKVINLRGNKNKLYKKKLFRRKSIKKRKSTKKRRPTKRRRPTKKRHHGMRTKSAQSKLNTVKRGFRYLRGGAPENVWHGNWDETFNKIMSYHNYTRFQIEKNDYTLIDGTARNSYHLIEKIKRYNLKPYEIKSVMVL